MERLQNIDWAGYRTKSFNIFTKLIRTKDPREAECAQEVPEQGKQRLSRCLTTLDLTSLGVGSCVGTGMYLVSGMVARKFAGPGVVFSFIIAAVASIFSGACYAEFGVRVPHTTGSAYMYSYVTVGEFIAFIIGWNMVLEYLIGTCACARALSACLDSLCGREITRQLSIYLGTIYGKPPDIIAFGITLLMMLVLAAGVKKSLVFNNVLNAINLSVWVFIMAAGLFYIDTDNWTEHNGFLPYGWSGVFSGAATCFYAFIGFDIIATTGEEANNPKRSIPLAIVLSLGIILVAYVSSSVMLTLIVPYDEVDTDAGLVQMFGHVQAPTCMYIVGIGALAGLTVSMFGSMFPMPRVVYAMAQDGLIFKQLAVISEVTGTPALATLLGGIAAAIVSLLVQLEILVEMMSIGTLLAYTLVSTCVLVLRYQPNSINLIELLPQSLRTPVIETEACSSTDRETSFITGYHGSGHTQTIMAANQRVMIRRVTRSSPDSDDTYPGDESEEYGRDDAFLVGDRTENKFYGSVAGGSTSNPRTCAPFCDAICYRLQTLSYLCPGLFPWVQVGPATEDSGMFVIKSVGVLYALVIVFDLFAVCVTPGSSTFVTVLMILLFLAILFLLILISRKPQNRNSLIYTTPGLPFVPATAIVVNIYLILNLSVLTLVRFTFWMIIGLIVYFKYGIKNSLLESALEIDGDEACRPTPTVMDRTTIPPAPPKQIDSHHRNIFEGDRPTYNYNINLYDNDGYPDPLNAWDRNESTNKTTTKVRFNSNGNVDANKSDNNSKSKPSTNGRNHANLVNNTQDKDKNDDPLLAWDRVESPAKAILNIRTQAQKAPYKQVEQVYNPKTNSATSYTSRRPPWAEVGHP